MPIDAAQGRRPPVVLGHPPNTFVANRLPRLDPEVEARARSLAANASLETTLQATASNSDTDASVDWRAHLAPGTEVYLPCLPTTNWQETAAACTRLREAGLTPVPHLAVRRIASANELDCALGVLADAGVDRLLLIAGDRRLPAGPFEDTATVLESGKLLDHGFRRIGVAAHPEGHPLVDQEALAAALARKVQYAEATNTDLWIVTQFAFSAVPLVRFLHNVASTHPGLRVRVGLPGPAKLRTLIGFAARCGAGASLRTLTRKPGVVRLFGSWSPDSLLHALAACQPHVLEGIHLFSFGGMDNTLRWLKAMAQPPRDAGRVVDRSAVVRQ